MQRRNFPLRWSDSILFYGVGLALALSLVFNGYLLYRQSRLHEVIEYEPTESFQSVEQTAWQQLLTDCNRANRQKDSLIMKLEQAPNAPPNQTASVHRTP